MDEDRQNAQTIDERPWGHRWGFADTRFVLNDDGSVTLTGGRYDLSGYRMYDFLPYIEKSLGVRLNLTDRQEEIRHKPVPAPKRNEAFCQSVEEAFPSSQYTTDDRERLIHSHGQTSADEVFRVVYARIERVADMVFHCESQEDARKIIQLAKEHDVCLVPFGGGTSVSCALKLPESEKRMIVCVDMKRMNKIEWIDKENLRAGVQAGITGLQLERELEKAGFTSGHEPDSLELSTVGGWIATNASGMKKNRYGNIENLVEDITMITPEGILEQAEAMPRTSMGIQPQNLFFGSEGNLGIITKAALKIHPTPEVKKYGSLIFPNFDLGTQFLYRLAHSGFVPASIRLVDNIQLRFGQALKPRMTGFQAFLERLKKFYVMKVRGFEPNEMVAATIVMEGSQVEVEFQERNIYALAKEFQGLSTGAENGRRGYMLTFAIAYIRDFLADFHVMGETFETSVPWSKISEVCQAVRAQAVSQHQSFNLPGKPYLSYRITQVYHTGVCIYFMYGIYTRGVDRPEKVFSAIEHSLRESIIAKGGSISHHHGVGKIRKDFMKQALSLSSIDLLKKIKNCADPQNIFGIRNNVFAE